MKIAVVDNLTLFDASSQGGTSANICVYLIFPETRVICLTV